MSWGDCARCGARIIWARTVPGGAWMPVDPERRPPTDGYACVAVRRDHLQSHYARLLPTGPPALLPGPAPPLLDNETRHVPHFASCPGRRPAPPEPPELPPNVVRIRRPRPTTPDLSQSRRNSR